MIPHPRSLLALIALGAALVFAAQAFAAVKATELPGTVRAGDYASLTVKVTPRSRCTIKVVYKSGTSKAAGLGAKTGTLITWRWRVGARTAAGRWPVTVDCGKAGRLVVRLRVR